MPQINFAKSHAPIQVEKGAPLMKALLNADLPVASSCNGDGVCAKCRVQVLSGHQNLSAANEVELFLREKFKLKANERISCQVSVQGNITIDTSYW